MFILIINSSLLLISNIFDLAYILDLDLVNDYTDMLVDNIANPIFDFVFFNNGIIFL